MRDSGNTFYRVSIKSYEFRESSGSGRKKFVALDAGGDSATPLLFFNSQDARIATNVNVARKSDLLRQGQDKLDRAAGLHNSFHQEVETSKANVARFTLFFEDAVFGGETDLHGQHHRKSSCGSALNSGFHQSSSEHVRFGQSYHCGASAATSFSPARGGKARFSFSWPLRTSTLSITLAELMAEIFHRNFFLKGQAGRIEAMLWTTPEANPRLAAVVCHPHPLFGGTMHNKVVFQAAKALHRRGVPVLRFNFRGAGLSEGVHDRGIGEREDVRVALDYLAEEFPGLPILLAGFSFGSWVGLRVGCEDRRVTDLIGLGIPADSSNMTFLRECTKPKLFVQGANDQFGSRENVELLFRTLPEPKELTFVENADHFFTGHLGEMAEAIDAWLNKIRPELLTGSASL
jgi:uncharacterized protein